MYERISEFLASKQAAQCVGDYTNSTLDKIFNFRQHRCSRFTGSYANTSQSIASKSVENDVQGLKVLEFSTGPGTMPTQCCLSHKPHCQIMYLLWNKILGDSNLFNSCFTSIYAWHVCIYVMQANSINSLNKPIPSRLHLGIWNDFHQFKKVTFVYKIWLFTAVAVFNCCFIFGWIWHYTCSVNQLVRHCSKGLELAYFWPSQLRNWNIKGFFRRFSLISESIVHSEVATHE